MWTCAVCVGVSDWFLITYHNVSLSTQYREFEQLCVCEHDLILEHVNSPKETFCPLAVTYSVFP